MIPTHAIAGDGPEYGPSPEAAAASAWAVLRAVLDPEVPVLSVVELGIVRDVEVDADGALTVILTPTYSGCPATETIADAVCSALTEAGASRVTVEYRLAPAWTTDWLEPAAREKLRRYGIAPPAHWIGDQHALHSDSQPTTQPIRFHRRGIECPRCASSEVEQLSAFGSTACKSLFRCLSCREPFEYFKPF